MPELELTCQELVELITAYLDNALSPIDLARFEDHLGFCEGCRRVLKQIKLTKELVGKLEVNHIEDDARNELLNAFRNWKNSPKQ